jgi:glycosyltransferase 2 family protein
MENIRKIILIIITTIIIYAIFLLITDINKILDKIINFNIIYVPVIITLVIVSWVIVYIRWHLILKTIDVSIPHSVNFQLFLAGGALGITPGKVGELFKSQILKDKFNIPRTKTAPLFILEKFLDVIGAMVVAVFGIWFLPEIGYLVIGGLISLIFIAKIITSKKLFLKALDFLKHFKFMNKFIVPLSSSHENLSNIIYKKEMISFIFLSILYWVVIGCAAYFVLLGLDIDTIGLINTISSYSSSLIIGAISFIPGGVGIAEASLIGLFTLQGTELSEAIVVVVLIRLFTLWFSTVSGFIALKTSKLL